jgi:hypothetical protein
MDVEPFALVTLPGSGFSQDFGPPVTWVVNGSTFYAPVLPFAIGSAPTEASLLFTKASQTVTVTVLPHTVWYHDGTQIVPLQLV